MSTAEQDEAEFWRNLCIRRLQNLGGRLMPGQGNASISLPQEWPATAWHMLADWAHGETPPFSANRLWYLTNTIDRYLSGRLRESIKQPYSPDLLTKAKNARDISFHLACRAFRNRARMRMRELAFQWRHETGSTPKESHIETIVSCDGEGCSAIFTTGSERFTSYADQTARFALRGWGSINGADYCPDCLTKNPPPE